MGEAYIYDQKTGECLGQISGEITEIRAENFEREPDEQTEKVLKMTTCAATFELRQQLISQFRPVVMNLLTRANEPWYCWQRFCGALWMFYWFPGRDPEIAYIMTLKQTHIFVNTKKRRTAKKYRKIIFAALAKIK